MTYITKSDCFEAINKAFEELEKRRELTKGFTNEELMSNGKCRPFNMLFFALQDGMNTIMKEVYEQYDT